MGPFIAKYFWRALLVSSLILLYNPCLVLPSPPWFVLFILFFTFNLIKRRGWSWGGRQAF